ATKRHSAATRTAAAPTKPTRCANMPTKRGRTLRRQCLSKNSVGVLSARVPCFRGTFAKPEYLRIPPRKHEPLEGSACFQGVSRPTQEPRKHGTRHRNREIIYR